jgi:hypothetical protein
MTGQLSGGLIGPALLAILGCTMTAKLSGSLPGFYNFI